MKNFFFRGEPPPLEYAPAPDTNALKRIPSIFNYIKITCFKKISFFNLILKIAILDPLFLI